MDTQETRDIPHAPSFGSGDPGLGLSTKAKVGIIVGALVTFVVLMIVLGFMMNNPVTTETLRDVAIIVLAIQSQIVLVLLAVLIYQLVVLTRLLRDDVRPMLESTQQTVNTVKGTATFVSDRVTKPAIAASSYVSGITRAFSVLFALRPRRGRAISVSAATDRSDPTVGLQEIEGS